MTVRDMKFIYAGGDRFGPLTVAGGSQSPDRLAEIAMSKSELTSQQSVSRPVGGNP
jgi:hypothetical protein